MAKIHRICCAFIALLPPGIVAAQPAGSPIPPTVVNPNRYAVTGTPAAARFFHLAATRRVDIALIGDSNTRQLTTSGHEDGMGRSFAARFGMYATRVDPFAGQGSWGSQVLSVSSVQIAPFQYTGAPLPAQQYIFSGTGFPLGYAYLPAGTDSGWTYNVGLTLAPDNLLNINANLRYHLSDYPMAGGTYGISVRAPYPGDPFTNFFSFTAAAASVPGVRDMSFTIPAGTRAPNGLIIVPADAQHIIPSVGPLLPLYHRVENTQRSTGIAYSPMWFQGGQSARKFLQSFYESDQNITAMKEWMRQAVKIQNASGTDGVLLVHILHGGNDTSDFFPSLGPVSGIPSYLPEGQADNTRGIINVVRNAWVLGGRDPANLFFCIGPYHPLADRLTYQQGYEQGWRDIAAQDPQVFTIAGTMLSTPDEFLNRGFNQSFVDKAHLSIPGYWFWGSAAVRALSRAICPGDFDENDTLAVEDIFAFINAWFAGETDADFNYSGSLEVQDIFDYLNSWFAGC